MNIAASVAILLQPFLPDSSKEILKQLNMKECKWQEAETLNIKAGHKINEPSVIFKKIEGDEIKQQVSKLK